MLNIRLGFTYDPAQMRRPIDTASSRAGFSLAELLIGMALFVSLSAVVIPAVVTQIKKGDVAALTKELETYTSAISSFYIDVARYPSEINQLVFDPDGASDVDDNATQVDDLGFWDDNSNSKKSFPNGRIKRWEGPYIDLGYVPTSGGIQTNMNGKFQRDFLQVCTGGKRYLAVAVADISLEDARSMNTFKEPGGGVGPVSVYNGSGYTSRGPNDGTETASGLIRWYDPDLAGEGNGDGVGNLVYLVVAVGSPGCTP